MRERRARVLLPILYTDAQSVTQNRGLMPTNAWPPESGRSRKILRSNEMGRGHYTNVGIVSKRLASF
jgi:hypothetical protein